MAKSYFNASHSLRVTAVMRCGKKEARLLGEGDDNKWFPVAGDEELIYQAICTN